MRQHQGRIEAGSNSRLNVFEECRFRAKLAFIDKIKEPVKPARADGKEDPMERGSRIHKAAEDYIKGTIETLAPELKYFAHEFEAAKKLFTEGKALGEANWNFDENWQYIEDPFKDPNNIDWTNFYRIKFRIKTDLTTFPNKKSALVVDYKTGKKYGNEVKHGEQLELYAVGAFLVYPDIESIKTELWYTDINDITSMEFTKTEGLRLLKGWDERNKNMINCTDFTPNPSMQNCKWCPFRSDRTGNCTVGVF